MQVRNDGKSKRLSCNGIGQGLKHYPTRKRADFHLVFLYERIYRTFFKEEIANGRETVCIIPQRAKLGYH